MDRLISSVARVTDRPGPTQRAHPLGVTSTACPECPENAKTTPNLAFPKDVSGAGGDLQIKGRDNCPTAGWPQGRVLVQENGGRWPQLVGVWLWGPRPVLSSTPALPLGSRQQGHRGHRWPSLALWRRCAHVHTHRDVCKLKLDTLKKPQNYWIVKTGKFHIQGC